MADIDVDGEGITTLEPVVVFCDMEAEDGAGVTIIGKEYDTGNGFTWGKRLYIETNSLFFDFIKLRL